MPDQPKPPAPSAPAQNNLDLGPEASANHLLGLLRAGSFDGPIKPGETRVLPGVFFSVDPDSKTSGRFPSAVQSLLNIDFAIDGKSRWVALHVKLGPVDLTDRQVVGVVCKSSSPQATTFQLSLRSGREGGFIDHNFRKTTVAYAAPSTHLDAIQIEADSTLPLKAPWRELVLLFRPENSQIVLKDLRIFIV